MNPEQLKPEYESVFTVTEYYDGPRKGIANFLGVPHLYECLFYEEKDGFSDQFLLTPREQLGQADHGERETLCSRTEFCVPGIVKRYQ